MFGDMEGHLDVVVDWAFNDVVETVMIQAIVYSYLMLLLRIAHRGIVFLLEVCDEATHDRAVDDDLPKENVECMRETLVVQEGCWLRL